MFAKLKKKLEEGESGGPERLPFSPRKLPGAAVAVRSPTAETTAHNFSDSNGVGTREEAEEVREKEGERVKKDVKPLPVENIDLVRQLAG